MKTLKKTLKYVLIFAIIAFSLFTIIYSLSQRNESYSSWIAIGVGVVGAVLLNYIHIILHEAGHLIGGKMGGFSLLSFRIGFINIMRVNGKLKVVFQKLGNNFGGVCQMLPPISSDIDKSFKRYVLGGIIMSAVSSAGLFLVIVLRYFFHMNELAFLFFSSAFPIVFLTLVLNLSSSAKVAGMTDGMFIKALRDKNPDGIAAIKTLNLQSYFVGGIRPKEVPLEIVEDFPTLPDNNVNKIVMLSNQMACYLDRGEFEKVIQISDTMERNLKFMPTIYHSQILGDVFFVEAKIKGNVEKASEIYELIIGELSKNLDLSVLRLVIAYNAIVLCDKNKASELSKAKKELFETYPMKGIAKMESDLIDELIK